MHSENQNWFETFFDGLALDMWRAAVKPETTQAEADFLASRFPAGSSLLDVPCGNGRHARALAAKGYTMTGFDLSPGFLAEAREADPGIEWVQGDMRRLPWLDRFDGAYCFGNSFGYFDHGGCCAFLAAVAGALRPGGRFVLETGLAAESILPSLVRERSIQLGDLHFGSRTEYRADESRLDIVYTFTMSDGRSETKLAHSYVHTLAELRRMFRAAGLEPVASFGHPLGEPYQLGSPRLVLTAEKR